MEVVKLNRSHKLSKHGFTHAWRFCPYDVVKCTRIEGILGKMHSYEHWWMVDPHQRAWLAGFGAKNKGNGRLVYWIAVRNEADVTAVLLQL